MEDKLLSIIVPVYNAENYLDVCVESIIRQTYTNWELILVNDGSKDSSPAICEKWSKIDPRIKVIHKTNGGASSARNAGLDIAKGDYIGFVDADDFISEHMYRIMVDALQNTDKKMVSCASTRVLPNGEIKPGTGESAVRNLTVTEALRAILLGEIGISMCSKVFERSVMESIRFTEGESYEELPMMIPLLELAGGIYHTGIPLYHYRDCEGSVTNLTWKKSAHIILRRMKGLREQICEYNMKECWREYAVYETKSVYSIAISMDKYYEELDADGRLYLKEYIRIMRQRILTAVLTKHMHFKDKILYLMIVTRTLRPVYKMMGKI